VFWLEDFFLSSDDFPPFQQFGLDEVNGMVYRGNEVIHTSGS
jgi:hypothetical protein